MPSLKYDKINLNDPSVVNTLLNSIKKQLRENEKIPLQIYNGLYFRLEKTISTEAGWYVILDNTKNPIYVGKSDNLNSRLNTDNGSIDNFANSRRSSDSQRNFIKKLHDAKILTGLQVQILEEKDLCEWLNIQQPLSELDRHNVEKLLNIFRNTIRV